ncbi:PadR family transcriptional regulator [Glaciihabitans arcticus]|uniref:PadR family transcriptional regulator n=1 Tax=Glaciihabitans arcticus TaxID=2668039 RepID=A0A4Q9GS51_9MICO|nr:PadR family transcriptional regulator [Glaciihabitans arcticus]TBN57395.1 PadR family transcriptional regulator [Glaciihabitans arcticus]
MEPLSRITPATIDVLSVLDASGEAVWGMLVIKSSGRPAGSVYPILERLERAGWVTSTWEDNPTRVGPRRRFYELTSDGAAAAKTAIGEFARKQARPGTIAAATAVVA